MIGIGIDTLITFNPFTVTPHTPLDEAVRLMSSHGIHHLPVVDGDQALVGMVSDQDIARLIDDLPLLQGPQANDPAARVAALPLVAEVLTQAVRYIAPIDPPESALALIVEHPFHCVPVVHAGRLEGIITSTDFLRELSYGEVSLARQSVQRVAQSLPERIDAESPLSVAMQQLRSSGHHYLLVQHRGEPRGIVSHRQLRRAGLGALLAASPWREPESPWHGSAQCVGDLLPIDAPVIAGNATLADAARQLLERRLQALPLVDSTRRMTAMVTECALLKALLG